jgi:aspartate carbamoyltransferase catalytic subunit
VTFFAALRAALTSLIACTSDDDDGQALLDVYTIQREIGRLDNIKVGLVGDLANGRTVRSLAYLLAKYDNVKLYFVAPDVVKMKVHIQMGRLFCHTRDFLFRKLIQLHIPLIPLYFW